MASCLVELSVCPTRLYSQQYRKTFITTIITRLLIPRYIFRVAVLDELWLWLVEAEVVAVILLVAELRTGTVAVWEVVVGLVVEVLRAGTVAFEEGLLL